MVAKRLLRFRVLSISMRTTAGAPAGLVVWVSGPTEFLLWGQALLRQWLHFQESEERLKQDYSFQIHSVDCSAIR